MSDQTAEPNQSNSRRGRPRRDTKQISLRLLVKDLVKFETLALQRNLSKSQFLTELLAPMSIFDPIENSGEPRPKRGRPKGSKNKKNPLKDRFKVKACQHGQSQFCVDGTIDGKRIREYFRTFGKAKLYCHQRNIEVRKFGEKLSNISLADRLAILACQERGISLTDATDYYLRHHQK
jgi:hypothetical protein